MSRGTLARLAMVVAALTLAPSCGGGDDGADVMGDATQETGALETTAESDTTGSDVDAPFGFDLDAIGGSGVTGQVTITPSGEEETHVEVVLDSAGAEETRPAHVHEGTCDDLNPTPAYPLDDVEGGTSSTTIDVGAEELLDGEYAVNVHESADELDTYIACGDIPSRDEAIQGS